MRDYFENAAHGIATLQDLINFFFHALLGFLLGTVQQDFVSLGEGGELLPRDFVLNRGCANRSHVA